MSNCENCSSLHITRSWGPDNFPLPTSIIHRDVPDILYPNSLSGLRFAWNIAIKILFAYIQRNCLIPNIKIT